VVTDNDWSYIGEDTLASVSLLGKECYASLKSMQRRGISCAVVGMNEAGKGLLLRHFFGGLLAVEKTDDPFANQETTKTTHGIYAPVTTTLKTEDNSEALNYQKNL
jgi:ABC-type hemin transport system ATPase subunit